MNKSKKLFMALALCGLIFTNGTASSAIAADKIITKEAAKNAAFTKAGITSSQATLVKVEYDANDDDHGQVYDVEFQANGYKYSYEIDANDGSILEIKKKKLKVKKKVTDSSTYIGAAAAKSIALKHAGLKSSAVQFTKAKLTTDDGIKIYDVEFYSGDTEYDYEINATTGKIIEFSSEPIDDGDDD